MCNTKLSWCYSHLYHPLCLSYIHLHYCHPEVYPWQTDKERLYLKQLNKVCVRKSAGNSGLVAHKECSHNTIFCYFMTDSPMKEVKLWIWVGEPRECQTTLSEAQWDRLPLKALQQSNDMPSTLPHGWWALMDNVYHHSQGVNMDSLFPYLKHIKLIFRCFNCCASPIDS